MTLARIRDTKQPRETKDWHVDLSKWFGAREDLPDSVELFPPTGATFTAELVGASDMMVKITMAGGSDGETYNAQVVVVTDATPPIRREIDVTISVAETQ